MNTARGTRVASISRHSPTGNALTRLVVLLVVLGALTGVAPARSQVLDPDRCWRCRDTGEHVAAGLALDLTMRSGIVAVSWRRSAWRRVALVAAVGTVYEAVETVASWQNGRLGESGHGFGLKDLTATVTGALVAEGVVAIGRALQRRG